MAVHSDEQKKMNRWLLLICKKFYDFMTTLAQYDYGHGNDGEWRGAGKHMVELA
jgi:hypothetical protein